MTDKPDNPPCQTCGSPECEGTHIVKPIPYQPPMLGLEFDIKQLRRALMMTSIPVLAAVLPTRRKEPTDAG